MEKKEIIFTTAKEIIVAAITAKLLIVTAGEEGSEYGKQFTTLISSVKQAYDSLE